MEKIIKDNGCEGDDLQKLISGNNMAIGGLFKWCTSTLTCYKIYMDVEP